MPLPSSTINSIAVCADSQFLTISGSSGSPQGASGASEKADSTSAWIENLSPISSIAGASTFVMLALQFPYFVKITSCADSPWQSGL